MNKYLLLRDNKQSGPYSVDELAAHGLKAYDLVWLEGKSAAWRYPSELAELKPFAPVVEEQPFDRFYRKTESKTIESPARDNTRVQQSSSIYDQVQNPVEKSASKQHVQLNTGSKKVYVSFPGAKSTEAAITKTPKEETRVAEPLPVVQPVNRTTQPIQAVTNDEPVFSLPRTEAQKETSTSEQPYDQRKKNKAIPDKALVKEAPVSKLLFRSVAAACLLLGGALIGLIINYDSQQKKFQQLNQLVQEIKQQDDPGTSKAVKKDNLSNEVLVTTPAPGEITPPAQEPEYKEDIYLPKVKTDRRDTKATARVPDTSHLRVVPAAIPAVPEDEGSSKKIDKVATELAKKNLWHLVSVDHNSYKTGVFGGISNLSLKVSNKSLLQLDHVEVEVLFLSPEKKTVNKQKVIFSNVSPGEQLSIDVPKSNRGVKIEYFIRKIATKEFEVTHTTF